MKKNIFLLWLQGWDKAPWLQKKVLESWRKNNPEWNLRLIDYKNLNYFVSDINYIYDKTKKISLQAKSDIIRLSLLKKYGGIWADSTLLCMQPLDHWLFEALKPSGIWMYHGHGAGLKSDEGPASWFIASEKNSALIHKWKSECDSFWQKNNSTIDYFWMDGLFKKLIKSDNIFKLIWDKTPFLYCEELGSSHTLAEYNCKMENNTLKVKEIFKKKPPYVLKLSSNWHNIFPDLNSKKFKKSNAYFAILMSKRNFRYKHQFSEKVSVISPYERGTIYNLLRKLIKKSLKIFIFVLNEIKDFLINKLSH